MHTPCVQPACYTRVHYGSIIFFVLRRAAKFPHDFFGQRPGIPARMWPTEKIARARRRRGGPPRGGAAHARAHVNALFLLVRLLSHICERASLIMLEDCICSSLPSREWWSGTGTPRQSRLTQHRGSTKAHSSFPWVLRSAWPGISGEEGRCQRSVCAAVSQRPATRNAVKLRRAATMKRDIRHRQY
eukprot:COSAG02_NODE_1829_length_10738_cov_4.595827_1_plen_187_part_00